MNKAALISKVLSYTTRASVHFSCKMSPEATAILGYILVKALPKVSNPPQNSRLSKDVGCGRR